MPDDEGGSQAPQTISHYEIGAMLGAGGMGAVFLGTDRRDGSHVAIKILAPQLAQDESFRERFEREAHVGALLRSPYVARLLDHGFEGGRFFIIMEYVEGETLRDAIVHGPVKPARALKIATQCARALEEAEARGVIHRDIKPENVLLGPGGTAKMADFGIAKQLTSGSLTTAGSFVGTLLYAAPERTIGRADHRSDIYSLGATLFHALAGQPPFTGDAFELMRQHADAPPPLDRLPPLPDSVREVIARCMDKDPEARFQSATGLAGALEAAASELRHLEAEAAASPAPAPPGASASAPEDTPTTISPPGGIPAAQPPAEEPTAAPVDTPTEVSPPHGTPVAPPAVPSGEAPTEVSPAHGTPVLQAQPAPAPQPAGTDGGATPPPAPPRRSGGTPAWAPFFGGGVAIAAVVGALFAFGVIGGGDDDDNGPTFTFDPSTTDTFLTETFPPIGTETLPPFDGAGESADNPIPFGDSGIVAGRMDVIIFEADDSVVIDGSRQYFMTLDVFNAGSTQLDVFFEPFYYMIGDKGDVYDEFFYACDDTPDRITGVVEPGDFAFGNLCFEVPDDDTNLVFYIELDDDFVYFEV